MSLASLLRPHPRSAPAEPLCCDSYVTDGRRLFRVVSQFATVEENVFASLEDCRTLEVKAYSPGELCALGLRPVRTPHRDEQPGADAQPLGSTLSARR